MATILLLNRTFLGRPLASLVESYHLATWVLLVFAVVVFRLCDTAKGAADTIAADSSSPSQRARAA